MLRYLQRATGLTPKILNNQNKMAVGNGVNGLPDPGIISHLTKFMTPKELTQDLKRPLKRTKIVATIGPKTEAPENAVQLIDAGLNVARLNFSHGDHAEHLGQMEGVTAAMKTRKNAHMAFMLDTKGPEIRTGNNEGGKAIHLKGGQLLQITTDYNHLGNSNRIACSYANLPHTTAVGKKILMADGVLGGTVQQIKGGIVTIRVDNDGIIGQKKNMCLPGCPISLHTVTEYDQNDIVEFGLKYKVDQIAVSFTRRGKDILQLRRMLNQKDPVHGPNIQLIAKIQNHQGIMNIDDIVRESDGIMIARGDMGMELPLQKVVVAQKYIADRTLRGGKYLINATQMMDSMEVRAAPTRAQVADITNSVLDLVDCTMLSGETTNGQFPFASVKYMKNIIQETEAMIDYKAIFDARKHYSEDKYALGIVSLAFTTQCDLIFLEVKQNFRLAQRISACRPEAHICVFTENPRVRSALAPFFGVYCFEPLREHVSKKRAFEEFLSEYGQDFARDKVQPERALFLGTDEAYGHVTTQEVVHA